MTLCKYRPQSVYEEQLLVSVWELDHLVKMLDKRGEELYQDGLSAAFLFSGASMALSTLASLAADADCEYWTDFMRAFERDAGTLEEGAE